MTIDDLIRESHSTALEKGWWPKEGDPERNFGEQIALMHSELSEVLEEFRVNGIDPKWFLYTDTAYDVRTDTNRPYLAECGKPEGIAAEFADALIRIFDTCGRYGIPLQEALIRKLDYNKSRSYRHGNKKA